MPHRWIGTCRCTLTMEVHVQFQSAPKALHHGDRAAAAVGNPGVPGAPAIPAEYGTDEDSQHRATERVVEGEAIAEPVRHGDGTNTNDTFRFEVQLTYRRRRMARGQG